MRLKKSSIAVLAALTMVIAGCSHGLGGRVSGNGNAESTVTFSVTDIPPNYIEMIREAQNPTARSILPNGPFQLNDAALKFVLTGRSNSGEALPEPGHGVTPVTLTPSGSDYVFTKTLGAYVWDLTLTAYKNYNDSASHHSPVLQGHCTVDLTTTNGTATFKMSTKGLTTPATVKVQGKVKDPDGLCTKYEIGIYNTYSGKLIEKYTKIDGNEDDTHAKLEEPSVSHSGAPGPYIPFEFKYGDSTTVTLNAGVYDYRMVFYKSSGSDYTVIGSWSDILIVNPGNDLDQDVHEIDPLNKKPEPPSNLRAYLVKGSEDAEGRYYYTKLTWDPGRYETNYELKITPYTYSGSPPTLTAGTPVTYGFSSTYTTPPAAPGFQEFVTSDIYHEGNLIYGSKECTLKLELGKVYDVAIRAHNFLGDAPSSTWVQGTIGAAPAPAGCELFDPAMSHINRFRITYNLNGGELILNGTSPSKRIQGTYSEYKSYTGASVNLMSIQTPTPSPIPNPATANYLRSGTAEFSGWGQIPSTPPYIPPTSTTTYNGYENAIFTASYGNSFAGTVQLETLADMDAQNIVIEYGDHTLSPPLTAVTPDASHTVTIPKKIGTPEEPTWIKISLSTTATPPAEAYSNMQCSLYLGNGSLYINKQDLISDSTGRFCTFSTQPYIPQKITLQVKATNSANQTVGKTFFINLY